MRIEELQLIEKIHRPPLDKLKEVDDFVETKIADQQTPIETSPSLKGALARPGFSVSAEDIDEVRQ
ncbi:MAG: hypothetical protein JNN15_15195 [Blastocatellia bacterium]|nr:hypothetical protein [Blastocatellia bacterium]